MDNLGESVLSFHYVAPMDQAQAIKLSLKGPFPLIHLAGLQDSTGHCR